MEKIDVSILLTTYNSSKYLNQQIDSLINQTYKNWTLYIRDDGSTDNTLEIINEFCTSYSNIRLIFDEQGNVGPKDSFVLLMQKIESEYYMFCDHDDVWLPEKIQICLDQILECEKNTGRKPIIVHTDLIVVNENLEKLYPSFWKFSHSSPQLSNSFSFHCAYNNVTGCTMLFNRYARDISLPVPKEAFMHDSWVAFAVIVNKGLIFNVEKTTILYRQHRDNTLGARKNPSFFSQLRDINRILKKNKNQYKAICSIKKISFFYFLLNKLHFYLRLKTNVLLNR